MLLTTELLPHCLAESFTDQDQDCFYNTTSSEECAAINRMLGEVLSQEKVEDVELVNLSNDHTGTLDSIVFGGGHSENGKVVAYNFKNAAKKSFLPLLGLITASSGVDLDPKQIPSAVRMLTAWWDSLVVLQSPQDDDAIAVVRAIGVLRLRSKWEQAAAAPTNGNLLTQSGLTPDRLQSALEKLNQLGVIQVIAWGGQPEDYSHQDNCWGVSF